MARGKKRTAKRKAHGGLDLVQDRATGIWHVHGTLLGQRVRRSTQFRDEASALAVVRDMEARAAAHISGDERTVTTYREVSERFRRERPWQSYPLFDEIERIIGDEKCAKIDAAFMVKLGDRLKPNGGPITLKRNVYSPVKAVLGFGAKKGLCAKATFESPQQPLRKDRKPIEWASDEWLRSFLDGCSAGHGSLRLMCCVLLMTTTGLRGKEATSLVPSDINWSTGEFFVKTKTTAASRVVIAPEVLEIMLPLKDGIGRLFGFKDRHTLNQSVERACQRMGIKYLSGHKFGRHAFATRWLKNGGSLKALAVAGRWSNTIMPDTIYGHLQLDDVLDEANRNAKQLVGTLGRKS